MLLRRRSASSSILAAIVPSASAALVLGLSGCFAGPEPETVESVSEAVPAEEAVAEASHDLVKGCSAGTSLCSIENDPDIGLIYNCCDSNHQCSAEGFCEPKRPLEHGIATPRYKVLGLVYSPPGKLSEVRYGSGSTLGTRSETRNSFASGVVANFESSALDINTTWKTGGYVGTAFDQKKTTTTTYIQAASPGRPDDELKPGEDSFFIWLNPEIHVNEYDFKKYHFQVRAKDGSMDVVRVTVAEILNPALRTDTVKWGKLAKLSATDWSRVLGLDPIQSGSALNTSRFKLVTTLPLDGPFYAGGDIPGVEYAIDNEAVKSNLSGFTADASVEILAGFELSFFVTSGLKVGGVWEWGYENSTEVSVGETQSASVKLSTDTVGYGADYNVYYDSLFRTFAFKKLPALAGSQVVTGFVSDAAGKPVANEVIDVVLADGSARKVATDARGHYRLRNVLPGLVELSVRGESRAIEVSPGAEPAADLTLTAR